MAITFDGATKRIVLDSASTSAAEIWSRWCDWHESNSQWPLAFRQIGGDNLGGELFISPYFFLLNGWRVRPMEVNHALIITGNLFVEGGGVPVVSTLGTFNVSVQYTVPVQAQALSTGGGGGGGGATAVEAAAAVWGRVIEGGFTAEQFMRLMMAALAGNAVNLNGPNPTFRSIDNSKVRLVGSVDGTTRTITSRDGT